MGGEEVCMFECAYDGVNMCAYECETNMQTYGYSNRKAEKQTSTQRHTMS